MLVDRFRCERTVPGLRGRCRGCVLSLVRKGHTRAERLRGLAERSRWPPVLCQGACLTASSPALGVVSGLRFCCLRGGCRSSLWFQRLFPSSLVMWTVFPRVYLPNEHALPRNVSSCLMPVSDSIGFLAAEF